MDVFGKGCGAQDWNRTSDTAIFNRLLYRLSYLGIPFIIEIRFSQQ
jgi:hypothetical protein